MARSPQITIYPQQELKEVVEALAEADGRSASSQILVWIKERPEVQEKLNGGTNG